MGIGGTQPDRRARHSATTKVRSNVTGPGGQVARPSCTRHVLPLPIAEARLSLLPRRAGNRAFCAADARGPRGAAGQELWGHAGGNGSGEKAGRQPLPSAGPAGLWRHSPCSADENGETPGSFLSSHPCQVGVPGLGPRQPAPGAMSPFSENHSSPPFPAPKDTQVFFLTGRAEAGLVRVPCRSRAVILAGCVPLEDSDCSCDRVCSRHGDPDGHREGCPVVSPPVFYVLSKWT